MYLLNDCISYSYFTTVYSVHHITVVIDPLYACTYRCLHGSAPAYLSESLHSVADIDARRRSTVDERAFPVAAACAWNALPVTVRGTSTVCVLLAA